MDRGEIEALSGKYYSVVCRSLAWDNYGATVLRNAGYRVTN